MLSIVVITNVIISTSESKGGVNNGVGVDINPAAEGYLQLALIDFGKAKDLRLSSYPEHNSGTGTASVISDHSEQNTGDVSAVSTIVDHEQKPSNQAVSNTVDTTVDTTVSEPVIMFVGNVSGNPP